MSNSPFTDKSSSPQPDEFGWLFNKYGITRKTTILFALSATLFLNTSFWLIAIMFGGWYIFFAICFGVFSALALLRLIREPLHSARKTVRKDLDWAPFISERLARTMLVGETVHWIARAHPISILHWFVGGLLLQILTIAALFADVSIKIVGLSWLIGTLVVAFRVATWHKRLVCVTNKRIIAIRGFLTVKVAAAPRAKLGEAQVIVPWHGRMLAVLRIIHVPYGKIKLNVKNRQLSHIGWVRQVEEFSSVIIDDRPRG